MTAFSQETVNKIKSWLWQPASSFPFAILRVSIGMILFVQALLILPQMDYLYGEASLIQESLASYFVGMTHLRVSALANLMGIDAAIFVKLLFALYACSLWAMILGLFGRLSIGAAWICHFLLFVVDGRMSSYGADTFAQILLFYLLFVRSNEYMVIGSKHKEPEPSATNRLVLRTMQIHLVMIYFSTAIAKAKGPQWWDGEVIWRALSLPQFNQFSFDWLAHWPWLAVVASIGTLFIEGFYPVVLLGGKIRKIWIFAIISMHIGIGAFLGLATFSALMIAFNFCAFFGSQSPNHLQFVPHRLLSLRR